MKNNINPIARANFQNHQNYAEGSAVRIISLQIGKLRIPAYQRKPDVKRVQSIVSAYDPHRDRPIEVSYRNGQYWIVDGQHRVRAHEIMKCTTVQCMVHYGLSYQQEASLFARQHDGEKIVSSRDRWNAFLEAEDEAPEEQAILDECQKFGFRVGKKRQSRQCVQLHCRIAQALCQAWQSRSCYHAFRCQHCMAGNAKQYSSRYCRCNHQADGHIPHG